MPLPKGERRAWRSVSWRDTRQRAAILYPRQRKDFRETGRNFCIIKVIKCYIVKIGGTGKEKNRIPHRVCRLPDPL